MGAMSRVYTTDGAETVSDITPCAAGIVSKVEMSPAIRGCFMGIRTEGRPNILNGCSEIT